MTIGLHWEPLIATSYAMLLVVIAGALEWMGRHSHKRASRFHTRGFRFRKDLDHWECPTGARLQRAEVDHDRRLILYRAPAHACNACPVKAYCTDSDSGREIGIRMDPWLGTEIGRFHRGMSLSILLLAALIIIVELFRHDHGAERWALIGALTAISLLIVNVARRLGEHAGA